MLTVSCDLLTFGVTTVSGTAPVDDLAGGIKNRPHVCRVCGKAYQSRSGLRYHVESVHLGKRYSCAICGKLFSSKYALRAHEKLHSGANDYQCTICGKYFVSSASLETHLLTHSGERPYTCDQCGHSFLTRSHLTRHQASVHAKERSHICEICQKSFSRSDTLKRHILSKHGTVRDHRCQICGASFKRSDTLAVHLKRHDGTKDYECDYCNKRFVTAIELERHLRTHTGEKPLKCSFCSKTFRTSSQLADHLRTHTGEKPFKCTECGAVFSTRQSLNNHTNAQACNYSSESWISWENLGFRIAAVLLGQEGKDWFARHRIPTLELSDRQWIEPDILIPLTNEKPILIDLKRSSEALVYKDREIYPRYASRMEFWCLLGKASCKEFKSTRVAIITSARLIAKLEDERNESNTRTIDTLIEDIRSLRSQEIGLSRGLPSEWVVS